MNVDRLVLNKYGNDAEASVVFVCFIIGPCSEETAMEGEDGDGDGDGDGGNT